MTVHPSLNDLAETLINQLDRGQIFPPSYNNPEELINPSTNKTKRPPRPPNGFLLCRKNVHRQARLKGICNMRVVSKVSGMLWRSASQEEKETYEKLSAQVNDLHSQRYPGYKYRPTTRPRPQPYIVPTNNIEMLSTLPTEFVNQHQPIIYPVYPTNSLDYFSDSFDTFQLSQLTQEDLASLYFYLPA